MIYITPGLRLSTKGRNSGGVCKTELFKPCYVYFYIRKMSKAHHDAGLSRYIYIYRMIENMIMRIRKGKPTDKREYLKTQKEAFPTIDTKRDSKFFDEKIKNKEVFVLEEKGKYVGHICFGKHILYPPFAGSIFIEELAVKQKYRGKGFGTALMEKLVKFCKTKKIPVIHLGTGDMENNKSIKYYEKQGFKKVGWLEDINPNSEYEHPQFFYAIMVKDWKKP